MPQNVKGVKPDFTGRGIRWESDEEKIMRKIVKGGEEEIGSLLILSKYGHIPGKILCSGLRRRPGMQAHWSTGLAPRHHVRCP